MLVPRRWPTGPVGGLSLDSVVVDGRRLFYVVKGSGQPVVLLHGLGASWRWWCRNIDALAQHYRVYALDLGRRERWLSGQGRVRPAEAAEILAHWMRQLGLTRAHLIGHSLGGLMAVQCAAWAPELVDRLVLVDAAALPFTDSLGRLTLRAIGPVPERNLDFTSLVVNSVLRTNPLVVWQTARDLLAVDATAALDQIRAPTLIVWGERDPMVPVTNAYRLQAAIAGSHLLVIPDAGHNPMYYHATTFNRAALSFLQAAASPLS